MEYAVEMRHITMRFPGVLANDDVNFSVRPGEIHALVGENGAGKSTLMNSLYGLYQPTEGEIRIRGERKEFRSALDAIHAGIGMVHQHFMLIPRLTVAENIALGAEPQRRGVYDRRRVLAEVQALSDQYGFALTAKEKVKNISLGMQQRVEIAKALYRNADILILDEPTAVLTPQEIDELGVMLKKLKSLGKTIIIITHKLKEVMDFSDRITVLRAGRVVDTVETAATDPDAVTQLMVGREVHLGRDRASGDAGGAVLTFEDVSYGAKLSHISFTLHAGEILGIAGIDNSGQKELTELAAGILKPTSGRILLDGKDVTALGAAARKAMGIGFIPQNRQRHGLVLDMPASDNLILGYQRRAEFRKGCFLRPKAIAADAEKQIRAYDVRPADAHMNARNFSGGNQQKIVVARESCRSGRLIVADQPSRGVDIGAIELIYGVFARACANGEAVLLSSLELDELLMMSDRIAVLAEGRLAGIVDGRTVTRYEVGRLMLAQHDEKEGEPA